MSDLRRLVAMARDLRARGEEDFVVATVVGVRGSSYRQPGARMIATSERWVAGSVSGGCIEDELVRKMRHRLRDARAALATYDSTDEDARTSFGLGCNGAIDVLQEIASRDPTDPLLVAERCIAAQACGAIATVVGSQHAKVRVGERVAVTPDGVFATIGDAHVTLLEGACRDVIDAGAPIVTRVGGAYDVFVEPMAPPPRLFVLGAGHDALPVVMTARSIGWDVVVCAPHARLSVRERFAGADELVTTPLEDVARRIAASALPLAVVMNHDYDHDVRSLAMLLRSKAGYIGVLGPRARTQTMLHEIGRCAADDARVHAPVGLAIGAETPEEIALSIVAEVKAWLTRASARSLRESAARIHDGFPPKSARVA
ncbi:MAG TPA: XdhC family protein [Polyangiaceae bacterium]|jgi:xanthine/CO dehydrogenase XdhC/CoxF family maturation factor|nr:XdhC family protein [Polyangiaceae bacterium]